MARIQKRGQSYRIFVSRGYVNGKQMRETTTYKPPEGLTKHQEEVAVKKYAADFEARVLADRTHGDRMRLKELYALWKDNYVLKELEPSVHSDYINYAERQILPVFGSYYLPDITPLMVDKFLRSFETGGRLDGKEGGYSAKTIAYIRCIFSSMLHYAVQYGLLQLNPCNQIRRNNRKVEAPKKLKYFTPEQAGDFLNLLNTPIPVMSKPSTQKRNGKVVNIQSYFTGCYLNVQLKYKVAYNLLIFTGMRRGELLALKWSDIDFEHGIISINKAMGSRVEDGHNVQYEKSPKTSSGYRSVSIPASVLKMCKEYQQEQRRNIMAMGTAWKGFRTLATIDQNFIFTQENGRQMCKDTLSREFHRIINCYNLTVPEEQKLPQIPLHGLRHTNATLLIANDADIKTVMNRLGHSDVSVTLGIYAHALQERDKKAADTLEQVLLHKQA
ncbi:tyrosine-type recombinase/integrase [Bacillota bacterium HCP28S3_F12]